MRFGNLRYLARTSGGTLDAKAARALNLPMPDDVLEQFVVDHGLDEVFQREYADLDLYEVKWELTDLPTEQIIASWSKFDRHVAETAEILRDCVDGEPHPSCMTFASWQAWLESGTWHRVPIFLDSVLTTRSGLHLVEGHTRVGVLSGLRHTAVPVRSAHACWVGRQGFAPGRFDWASVLEAHPLSFHDWLFDGIGDDDRRGEVAGKLMELESTFRYTHSFLPTFQGLVALASVEKNSGVEEGDLVQLALEWRRELELCAGRQLWLSA